MRAPLPETYGCRPSRASLSLALEMCRVILSKKLPIEDDNSALSAYKLRRIVPLDCLPCHSCSRSALWGISQSQSGDGLAGLMRFSPTSLGHQSISIWRWPCRADALQPNIFGASVNLNLEMALQG